MIAVERNELSRDVQRPPPATLDDAVNLVAVLGIDLWTRTFLAFSTSQGQSMPLW